MYVMIIHVLIQNKFFSFKNLSIRRVITCFTVCLCITKNEKFSAFCVNCIEVFNTFFSVCKLFDLVPNGVVNVVFFFGVFY